MNDDLKKQLADILEQLEAEPEEVTLADIHDTLKRIEDKLDRQPLVLPVPYPGQPKPWPWESPFVWQAPTVTITYTTTGSDKPRTAHYNSVLDRKARIARDEEAMGVPFCNRLIGCSAG